MIHSVPVQRGSVLQWLLPSGAGNAYARGVTRDAPHATEVKRITLDLTPGSHRALRLSAFEHDLPMSEILRGLVELWLNDDNVRAKVLQSIRR